MQVAGSGAETAETDMAGEAEKRAALRRIKAVATGALIACIGVFLWARWMQEAYPAFAYVAAFAEAAAIGGLADWYAVVALFRRPMGLPIPHTAIIPANRDRIATNLGKFIEDNFLDPSAVRLKLREVDFAQMVAQWLADPKRADGLSRYLVQLAPRLLDALEGSGLREFAAARIREQLSSVKAAPLAGDLLAAFTADRRHQQLLDAMLRVFSRFLSDEEALETLRLKIRQELPGLARLFRADAYLLKKIVASAASLMEEVRADPDHPLRAEFDGFIEGFVERLRRSPEYAQRAEKLKNDLLSRPELAALTENFWAELRRFVEQDVERPGSVVRRRLADLLAQMGRQLAEEPQLRADMNEGFVAALATFIETQKSGVSAFIAEQVQGWDVIQMTRLIELNIGRDLQYIRFNGMIIGGIAGLALHLGEKFVFGS